MIGKRAGVDPVALLLTLVFDLAEESRTEERVGLLYVGEIRREQSSLNLESSISVDGSHLSAWADDKEFVAITHDPEAVVGVRSVNPPLVLQCKGGKLVRQSKDDPEVGKGNSSSTPTSRSKKAKPPIREPQRSRFREVSSAPPPSPPLTPPRSSSHPQKEVGRQCVLVSPSRQRGLHPIDGPVSCTHSDGRHERCACPAWTPAEHRQTAARRNGGFSEAPMSRFRDSKAMSFARRRPR